MLNIISENISFIILASLVTLDIIVTSYGVFLIRKDRENKNGASDATKVKKEQEAELEKQSDKPNQIKESKSKSPEAKSTPKGKKDSENVNIIKTYEEEQ